MCRAPPHSRLAVPSALARLLTGRAAEELDFLEMTAAREDGDMSGPEAAAPVSGEFPIFGYSVDLTDGFYQFKSERMATFFGLGLRVSVAEAERISGRRLPSLFCDRSGSFESTKPDDLAEAAFLGLAMGWSWALFYCHEAVSECMRQTLLEFRLPATLVGDVQKPAHFNRCAPAMAPYADNVNMLALDKEVGDRVFGRLVERLRERGFVLRDEVQGTDTFEFLGMELCGRDSVLRHTRRRTWRLWFAMTRILEIGYLPGEGARVLCGHLCHHFGLFTPGMVVMQALFRFAREAVGSVVKLPRAVADEVRVARALLFVAESDLRKDFGPVVYSTDASLFGYALHETPASDFMVGSVARWKERWRFKVNEKIVDRGVGDVPVLPLDGGCEAAPHVADAFCAAEVEEVAPPPALVARRARGAGLVREPRRRPAASAGAAVAAALRLGSLQGLEALAAHTPPRGQGRASRSATCLHRLAERGPECRQPRRQHGRAARSRTRARS